MELLGKIVIIVGVLASIFGVIFHLQGQSIVGPESSFMYSNPEWITYGTQITITGAILIVAGIIIELIRKR